MEQFSNQHDEDNLTQLLTDYEKSLKSLSSGSHLSSRQVLGVLRLRDRIQELLSKTPYINDDALEKLLHVDLELKQNAVLICQAKHFKQLRQSLEPPTSYWWWYLETSPKSTSKSILERFGWLWNVGTVVCLVLATSFITQTAKAFSTEGFDFLGTLSTISQSAGLVFVAGGALTDKGKQAVVHFLSSIRIPTSLHNVTTFIAALLLLIATYGVNHNLHIVGNWYFQQAQNHEYQGEFSQAFKAYKRSLNFSPDDYKTHVAVGFLYEKLGNFDQAIEEYKIGTAFGIPEFLNAQARAILMGEFQKNDWQGGIDKPLIREAEDLLDRADKSITNFENVSDKVRQQPRLSADIQINKAILKMAEIRYGEEIDENSQNTLNQIVDDLFSLERFVDQEQSSKSDPLTEASTLGEVRTKCFYQKAFSIGWLIKSPVTYGVDHTIQKQDEDAACWPFSFDSSFSTTPDAFLLGNYKFLGSSLTQNSFLELKEIKDIKSFLDFIYLYPLAVEYGEEIPDYANKVTLIQEPDTWLSLAEQLSQSIQTSFIQKGFDWKKVRSRNQDNSKIVWRFLLSKDGQTIAHFAYDDSSRVTEQSLPFATQSLQTQVIEQLSLELRRGGKLEFADFKVVLSKDGKILHLLPWQMAYTTGVVQCKEQCGQLSLHPRVRSVFQSYTPNLSDSAEFGALRSVVLTNSFYLAIDTTAGFYYTEPAIFKLKLSADGQIVDYQAMNQIAIQKFGERFPLFDLESIQFPELQKPPYTNAKLEHQGLTWQIIPW